jgi:hypothetical protein
MSMLHHSNEAVLDYRYQFNVMNGIGQCGITLTNNRSPVWGH